MSKFDYLKGKIIILNGAPNTGKDTIADVIVAYQNIQGVKVDHLRFKDELYTDTAQHFDLNTPVLVELCTERALKERAFMFLGGRTPREALIYVSEDLIKPACGKEHYGFTLVGNTDTEHLTVVSDGGFKEEVQAIIEEVGAENILIVNLNRQGCTWEGDSRRALSPADFPEDDVNFMTVNNDYTVMDAVALISQGADDCFQTIEPKTDWGYVNDQLKSTIQHSLKELGVEGVEFVSVDIKVKT